MRNSLARSVARILPIAVVLGALAFTGCAASAAGPSGGAYSPDWIQRGNGAFTDPSGARAFYAVGRSSGVRNRAVGIQIADQTALRDLAREITARGASAANAAIVDHWADRSTQSIYSLARLDLAGAVLRAPAPPAPEPATAPEPAKEASKPQDWWAK